MIRMAARGQTCLLSGIFVLLSLPVLAPAAQAPVWVALTLVACFAGAGDHERSFRVGTLCAVAPLLSLPLLLAGHGPVASEVATAAVAAVASGFGYGFLSHRRTQRVRRRRSGNGTGCPAISMTAWAPPCR
jgi:hypothetical protein